MSNDRKVEFGAKCAIAVRESKTHRQLVAKLFNLHRQYSDQFQFPYSFVSNTVIPGWRDKNAALAKMLPEP
jgi:hypothetical protein